MDFLKEYEVDISTDIENVSVDLIEKYNLFAPVGKIPGN